MTIRVRYAGAHIFCSVGPLLAGTDLDTAQSNITAAVGSRVSAGDTTVTFHPMTAANAEPGCDWHPSLETHRLMAERLQPVVAVKLGW